MSFQLQAKLEVYACEFNVLCADRCPKKANSIIAFVTTGKMRNGPPDNIETMNGAGTSMLASYSNLLGSIESYTHTVERHASKQK